MSSKKDLLKTRLKLLSMKGMDGCSYFNRHYDERAHWCICKNTSWTESSKVYHSPKKVLQGRCGLHVTNLTFSYWVGKQHFLWGVITSGWNAYLFAGSFLEVCLWPSLLSLGNNYMVMILFRGIHDPFHLMMLEGQSWQFLLILLHIILLWNFCQGEHPFRPTCSTNNQLYQAVIYLILMTNWNQDIAINKLREEHELYSRWWHLPSPLTRSLELVVHRWVFPVVPGVQGVCYQLQHLQFSLLAKWMGYPLFPLVTGRNTWKPLYAHSVWLGVTNILVWCHQPWNCLVWDKDK